MGHHHLERIEAMGGVGKSYLLAAYAYGGESDRSVSDPFGGDLDEYAAWLRSRPGSESGKPDKPAKAAVPVVASTAAATPATKPGTKPNPHKLQKAESRVAELEAQLAGIETELARPATYTDGGARAAELGSQQARLRGELESAEAALLALYEAA